MSDRQTGNRYENEAAAQLDSIGYWTFAARGSRGAIDLLAIHLNTRQIVAVQVGTRDKSYRKALEEMRAAPSPPGMLFLVARRLKLKNRVCWRWHFNKERNGWGGLQYAVWRAIGEAS